MARISEGLLPKMTVEPSEEDTDPVKKEVGAELLALALRAAGGAAWSVDLDEARIELVGSDDVGVFGFKPANRPVTVEQWLDTVHEGDRVLLQERFRQAIASGSECRVEYRYDHPALGLRWVLAIGKHVPATGGRRGKLVGISLDVTDSKRFEHDLTESERRGRVRTAELEAVLEAVPAAVWIAHDAKCLRITGNRAATELLRLPVGANSSLTAPDDERPVNFEIYSVGVKLNPRELPMQRAAAEGIEIRGIEEDIVFDDGTTRRIYGNAAPLLDDAGKVRGALAAFIDITARKAAEESLREADRHKDEFLAVLSHELRNPLAAIDGVVALMRRTGIDVGLSVDPEGDWAREVLERQVRQLTRLIDDLLDVSRISQGKISLRLEPTDAVVVATRAVTVVRPMVEKNRQTLRVDTGTVPLPLIADPARLEQIVVNLLTNALRYTDAGGTIELSARRDAENVVITVRDNGLGIAPEMIPRVFDLFTQLDASPGRMQNGLGIGLTLVRDLTQMHGGTIVAESEGLGHGSGFTLRLPLAKGEEMQPVAPVASSPSRVEPPARERINGYILLVDDNMDAARGLSRLLEASGYEVMVVHDGLSALEAAMSRRPAAVLLDIGLPGMDGYEVARRLRGDLSLTEILLIAISGYGQESDRSESAAVGIDHHLTKPVVIDDLFALLTRER